MAPKQSTRQTESGQTPQLLPYPEVSPAAHRLFWVGVLGFGVIIVAMWGWSLQVQVAALRWDKSSERKLIQKTKTDWDAVFNQNQTTPAVSQTNPSVYTKQQVTEALRTMLVSGTAAASASSSIKTSSVK